MKAKIILTYSKKIAAIYLTIDEVRRVVKVNQVPLQFEDWQTVLNKRLLYEEVEIGILPINDLFHTPSGEAYLINKPL